MAKRRAYGSGSIFLRGRFYYLQTCVNGKLKLTSLKTSNRQEAEKKAAELRGVVMEADTKEKVAVYVAEARKLRTVSTLKVVSCWDAFEKSAKRPKCGASTLRKYKCFWNQFSKWLGKTHPVIRLAGEIDTEAVEEYFTILSNRKLSAAGFNGHRQALHLVFRILKTEAGLEKNPVDDIAKSQASTHGHKELSEKQLKALMAVFEKPGLKLMHKDEMHTMFNIGVFTGLRLADCALLKWEGVDMDRRIISTMPVKTQRKSKVVVIPLHPALESELLNAQQWANNSGFVLPNVAARYQSNPSGVQKDAVWIFEQAGMKTTEKIKGREFSINLFGFHSLRHTFVSVCAKAGVPLAVVQSIVGHGNPAMTRHYVHIGEENTRKAIATLPSLAPDSVSKQSNALLKLRGQIHSLVDTLDADELKAILATIKR